MIGPSQRRRFVLPAAVCAGFLGLGSQAHAVTLVADALGTDSAYTAGYWGVAAASGSGYVSSISIDLSADFGAFFDFDGEGNFGNALGPVLSSLVGLTAADISTSFTSPVGGDTSHPAVLTFSFAPGSFAAGDSFRFGADTDFFVSDPAPGGAIGSGGALFSAVFGDGGTDASTFAADTTNLSSAVVGIPAPGTLAEIIADASGEDSAYTAGYWGVAAAWGSGYISSISFDLSADFGAFFDFDGEGNFGNALGPVLSSLVGLTEADISAVFGDPVAGIATHPAVLTFNFAPGSFAAGDSFRFGADTDFFVSDPAPGGAIGSGGGIFSVTLETGQSGTAAFSDLFVNRSISAVTIQTTIPEPSTLVLLAIGVVGLGVAKRRASFIQA